MVIFPGGYWTGPAGAGLAAFAASALITDYLRAIRQRRAQLKEPLLRAARKTVLANRRHYGGMIVHFGITVVAIGLVGSGLFRSESVVNVAPGDVIEIAGEKLRFEGVRRAHRANYFTVEARMTLLNSGRVVTPERRTYPRQKSPMTETGIDSTPLRDVYVVLGEPAEQDRWAVRVFVNPLVEFIWMGGMIMISGLALSLSGRRKEARAKEALAGATVAAK
jgi:cytochrome c-type biogenesis protein CcmF